MKRQFKKEIIKKRVEEAPELRIDDKHDLKKKLHDEVDVIDAILRRYQR